PQTLAYGLNDSPVGLAAWIVEKWRTWSDCGGEVERRFTKDELLTTITIYWVTQTINSSTRLYYENQHNPWLLQPGQRLDVPYADTARPGRCRARTQSASPARRPPPRPGRHSPPPTVPQGADATAGVAPPGSARRSPADTGYAGSHTAPSPSRPAIPPPPGPA